MSEIKTTQHKSSGGTKRACSRALFGRARHRPSRFGYDEEDPIIKSGHETGRMNPESYQKIDTEVIPNDSEDFAQ